MKKKDLAASVFFLIIAGILFFHADSYPVKESGIVVLNPGFYPQTLAVILGFLSVLLFFTSLKKDYSGEKKQDIWKTGKAVFLFVMTMLLLVSYPFMLKYFGFATSAFIFIFFLIVLLTENARSKILSILGISLGLSGLMYFVFKIVLRIPFPSGMLI